MFAGGSGDGRRLGFFDSIFVDVQPGSGGAVRLGTGIENPVPLLIAVVVVALFILAVFAVYDALLERRRQLLAEAE